ncbi:MAG: hypothetical protein HOV87_33405, partial [Catenulispora sp.]|nr:hypothetical protein [Catenulispora sp.]
MKRGRGRWIPPAVIGVAVAAAVTGAVWAHGTGADGDPPAASASRPGAA